MLNRTLVEHFKIVDATAGAVTTNGGVTADYVTLKNAHRAWIVVQLTQAVGHATVLSPKQASAVAGTGVKAISACRIWANEDTAASDTLVEQTAATTYTVTNDIKKKLVVFEINPEDFDVAGGFDVLGFATSDSSQATNFVAATYWLANRYAQATPPTAITD